MNTPTLQGSTSALSRIEGDTTHKDGKGCLPDFAEQSVPEIFGVSTLPWSPDHAREPAQLRITTRKSEIDEVSNRRPSGPDREEARAGL